MKKTNKYELFDFQDTIEEIRQKANRQIKEGNDNEKESAESLMKVLDSITSEMEIEDLPLYQQYLQKFDVDKLIDNLKVEVPDDDITSEADIKILMRLIFASFSSKYDLINQIDSEKVTLTITVESSGQKITKSIDELWSFQIMRLFTIYLEEQLNLDVLIKSSEEEREALNEERQLRIMIFNKKLNQLLKAQEGRNMLDDLDELLHSKKKS